MRYIKYLIIILLIPISISATSVSRTNINNVNTKITDFCDGLNKNNMLNSECNSIYLTEYNSSIVDNKTYLYNVSPFFTQEGEIIGNTQEEKAGIRVTIYLKNSLTVSGNGTLENPYVLK